jgi:hypothetical protein
MIYYNFQLIDEDELVCMTTSIDEPNPTIDKHFWNRFMEGDTYLEYTGTIEESEED